MRDVGAQFNAAIGVAAGSWYRSRGAPVLPIFRIPQ
jgi:hypothetical protein